MKTQAYYDTVDYFNSLSVTPPESEFNVKLAELEAQAKVELQQKEFNDTIQNYLDTKAQEYKWDNMQSARAAVVPIKDSDSDVVKEMKNNAETLTDWYFEVWATASQIQYDVENGDKEMPSVNEVLVELPAYE